MSRRTSFIQSNQLLKETIEKLDHDMSIAEFLETYFGTEEYANLRNSILKMVQGYEAADPKRVSVDYLRRDVLGKLYHADGWIKEGYGDLLIFLQKGCVQNKVQIILNSLVTSIDLSSKNVVVTTADNNVYEADQVILTIALPVLKNIEFILCRRSLIYRGGNSNGRGCTGERKGGGGKGFENKISYAFTEPFPTTTSKDP